MPTYPEAVERLADVADGSDPDSPNPVATGEFGHAAHVLAGYDASTAIADEIERIKAEEIPEAGGAVGGMIWDDGEEEWVGASGSQFTLWNRTVDANGDPVGPIPEAADGLEPGDVWFPEDPE